MEGVNVARSLTDKGTNAYILETKTNLRTVFSVEEDESSDPRRNTKVQKGDRE